MLIICAIVSQSPCPCSLQLCRKCGFNFTFIALRNLAYSSPADLLQLPPCLAFMAHRLLLRKWVSSLLTLLTEHEGNPQSSLCTDSYKTCLKVHHEHKFCLLTVTRNNQWTLSVPLLFFSPVLLIIIVFFTVLHPISYILLKNKPSS